MPLAVHPLAALAIDLEARQSLPKDMIDPLFPQVSGFHDMAVGGNHRISPVGIPSSRRRGGTGHGRLLCIRAGSEVKKEPRAGGGTGPVYGAAKVVSTIRVDQIAAASRTSRHSG